MLERDGESRAGQAQDSGTHSVGGFQVVVTLGEGLRAAFEGRPFSLLGPKKEAPRGASERVDSPGFDS
jgi:hypothetical protein